eukprot:5141828-Pyramimonas_sp.AAC.1
MELDKIGHGRDESSDGPDTTWRRSPKCRQDDQDQCGVHACAPCDAAWNRGVCEIQGQRRMGGVQRRSAQHRRQIHLP